MASCSSLLDDNAFIENPVSFGLFQHTLIEELDIVDVEVNPFSENENLEITDWIKIGG